MKLLRCLAFASLFSVLVVPVASAQKIVADIAASASSVAPPAPGSIILPSTENDPKPAAKPASVDVPSTLPGGSTVRHKLENRPRLTKKYWELWVPAIGLQIADTEFTEHCLQNHAACNEVNPIFGRHPSRAKLYSVKLGYTGMAMFFSQKWWRDPYGYTDYAEKLPIAFDMIGAAGAGLDVIGYPWGSPIVHPTSAAAARFSRGDRWIAPREIPAAWKEMYEQPPR
jgi:hypothetical protein